MFVFCAAGGDVPQCAMEDFGVCWLHNPVWLHCSLCLRIHRRSCGGSYNNDYRINDIVLFFFLKFYVGTRNNCVVLLFCFSVLVHPWSPPLSTMMLSSLNAWVVTFAKYKSGFQSVSSYALSKKRIRGGICRNISHKICCHFLFFLSKTKGKNGKHTS